LEIVGLVWEVVKIGDEILLEERCMTLMMLCLMFSWSGALVLFTVGSGGVPFLFLVIVNTPEMMFLYHVLSFLTDSLHCVIMIVIGHEQAARRRE